MHFAELSSPQVAALRESSRVPVLLLPVGAVEPHGPHAPLGTDPLISLGMCERTAARLADDPDVRVLILPPLSYGVTRYAAAFAGAVHIGAETLHALVVDVCTALADQGLPRVLLVNNHFEPDHVATLRRAVRTVESLSGHRIGHLDLVRRANALRLTEEFRSGECHAGRYETSLVLAERPDLVDTGRMRSLPRVPVNMPAAMAEGRDDFLAMGMEQAYCGSPAEATGAEGEATFDTLTTMLVEAIRDLA
ncbi:creatinine amidohydrolase [Prauserella shujinwangii]|uniref:Creatinine amidohydrolase n=1 Tax=Prauserella shujinwangii TaxID=1453103 RepID=A0A2T0LZF5_9PSEU|nr:creatininase family protein [Prauserella shujinwangii]PRX49497.1 creatinine amidohydrolase [Prauserella shujinwangii]